jgi:hypothetical protein
MGKLGIPELLLFALAAALILFLTREWKERG